MIKTIIFDLGGVYFSDGTAEAIQEIAYLYNIDTEAVKSVLKGELGTQYRVGAITAKQFWDGAKSMWNIETENAELAQIWLKGYSPIEGTVTLIDALRNAGYELIFLSDNVKERVEYLDTKYHFLEKFDDGVFSHIVHTRKPDPRIYENALDLTTSRAIECVYIDDKPELLEPAKVLGMSAVHFQNPEQLKKDLSSLGINL